MAMKNLRVKIQRGDPLVIEFLVFEHNSTHTQPFYSKSFLNDSARCLEPFSQTFCGAKVKMSAGIIDFLPKILTHVRKLRTSSEHSVPIVLILVLIERGQNFTPGRTRSLREKQAISPETLIKEDTVEKAQKSGCKNKRIRTWRPSRVSLGR